MDAVRNAREALADAEYDKITYELQQQIDALDEIENRWSKIAENVQKVQDALMADKLLGDKWRELVLIDDDNLFNKFNNAYTQTSNEQYSIDKQVESNERLSATIQSIITKYEAQEMSLSEAQKLLNQVYAHNADGKYTVDEQRTDTMSIDKVTSINGEIVQTNKDIQAAIRELLSTTNDAEKNTQYITGILGNESTLLAGIEKLDAENKKLYEEMLKKVEEQNKAYTNYTSSYSGGGGGGGSSKKGSGNTNSGPGSSYADAALVASEKWKASQSGDKERVAYLETLQKAMDNHTYVDGTYANSGGIIVTGAEGQAQIDKDFGRTSGGSSSSSSSSSSSGGSGGSRYESTSTTHTTSETTTTTKVSGPASDPDVLSGAYAERNRHHSGVNSGYFGKATDKDTLSTIQYLANGKLGADEVPIIGLKDEIALTKEQQQSLIDNFRAAYMSPNFSALPMLSGGITGNTKGGNTTYNVSIDNISLPDVRDVDGFAKAFKAQFPLLLSQEISKHNKY